MVFGIGIGIGYGYVEWAVEGGRGGGVGWRGCFLAVRLRGEV